MNINISVSSTPVENGRKAAAKIAEVINRAIAEKGHARIVLSTGASQFEMFDALVKMDVDWSRVEMFHLDEYVDLPETHIASFRKYLKERFVNIVHPKAAHFVEGEGDVKKNIERLTKELRSDVIDLGVIGIGENGHIAFNDPPADFDTTDAYRIVNLDHKCRMQQVGEGWFATEDDVPRQAISMLPRQIMSCKVIVSVVPHAVKAKAVYDTITQPVNNMVPATLMKTHPDWNLFIDDEAASLLIK
ncbi:MAG: glucosamine-6-phosphate deaminase [bacterium]|jgi:glucosamine-6-phosphate deaminase|nr:glucosamine-6-phosphate deaminase [bacterium]